jgi:sulfite exporter TauE/SafE
MAGGGLAAEALLLGISSGPVCLASCSPVLLPLLAAEGRSTGGTGVALAEFLGGRLAGYLGFACLAWFLGLSLSLDPRARTLVFGLCDAGLAVLMVGYGLALRPAPEKSCEHGCPAHQARRFADQYRSFAPVALGLVSGLTLCPPFVAAGVRAAQTASLAQALLFFACFFVGTSIWFAPSISMGAVRRFAAVAVVARFTLFLLAAFYAYAAAIVLGRFFLNA